MIQNLRLKHSLTALAFVFAATSLSLASSLTAHAAQQTCVWTGAVDTTFSNPGNWSNCAAATPAIPQAGDIVSIDRDVLTTTKNKLKNDLAVSLGGVVTKVTTSTKNTDVREVNISTLKLVSGGSIKTGDDAATSYQSMLGVYIADANNALGTLTGEGGVELKGDVRPGKLDIKGILTISSYTGSGSSTIDVKQTDKLGGLVLKGAGTYTGSTVYLENTGSPFTYTFPITVDSSNMQTPPISVSGFCKEWGMMNCASGYTPVTITFTGAITLAKDAQVRVGDSVTLNVTGAVTGGKLTKDPASSGTLVVGGVTYVSPVKTTDIAGVKESEYVVIGENETGIMAEGSLRSSISVYKGGLLKGVGSLKYGLTVYNGGKVAPGMSPGCISVGSLSIDGEYAFELGGTDPCTGYDQIKVTNPGTTYSTVSLNSTSSILSTSRFNGYTPKMGEVYTIIDNAGAKAVQGTFKGLAEGAEFEQNGLIFKISYVGGNGNDVTLTVVGIVAAAPTNIPATPDTGFELIRTNPMLVAFIAVASALVLTVVGRQLAAKR